MHTSTEPATHQALIRKRAVCGLTTTQTTATTSSPQNSITNLLLEGDKEATILSGVLRSTATNLVKQGYSWVIIQVKALENG